MAFRAELLAPCHRPRVSEPKEEDTSPEQRGLSELSCSAHEIMLERVSVDPKALQHVAEALKGDREIVMTAVSNFGGYALQYATEELKGDREIVMTAVSKDGFGLEYATEELRGDRAIVMAAVSNNGWSLHFTTEELKGDREIVMTAVSTDGLALQFATEGLKEDEEMMQLALGGPGSGNVIGMKVTLLSGRCCSEVFSVLISRGAEVALRRCAASLDLDPDYVATNGTFMLGLEKVEDISKLEPGKLHELTLVLS